MAENIFVITSVINTGNHPWSYTNIRSTYTPDERFQQTLKTIQTIREKVPNVHIILSECSEISKEQEQIFLEKVDTYLNFYDNEEIRNACLNSNRKGYGECLKTYQAFCYILLHDFKPKRFFKISGRYFLNDYFDIHNFSETEYTFNKILRGSDCHPTVLYSVPFSLFNHYEKVLIHCKNAYEKTSDPIGYENLLPPCCTPASYINCVGASGYIGIDNSFYSPTPNDV